MSTNAKQQGAEITVYWLERSRAQRLIWLLEELNLKYNIKTYKRNKDGLGPPELKEVHPLGKSPVVGLKPENAEKPLILAESAAIIEYLTDYFGKSLVPKRYQEGKEGQLGGENEEWMRYRFFMHYAEGSLVGLLVLWRVMNNIKNAPVPFFIKPITRGIANKVENAFLKPNFDTSFGFLEQQLASAPNGGNYLCGSELTAADILISFPIDAAIIGLNLSQEKYPKLHAYVERIKKREAFQRAIKRVEEETGEKYQLF